MVKDAKSALDDREQKVCMFMIWYVPKIFQMYVSVVCPQKEILTFEK